MFPSVYNADDDLLIARKRLSMRGQKADKRDMQKATPPLLPSTWSDATAVQYMYAKEVVVSFHAYMDSTPAMSLRDKAFIFQWKNTLQKSKDKHNSSWVDKIIDILQVAYTGNWDFRETFYNFCMQVNIRSSPKSLIEAYKTRKQGQDETGVSYLMSMENRSGPIIDALGGEKVAIEIAIDGLALRQLQVHLTELLNSGIISTFPECQAKAREIIGKMS